MKNPPATSPLISRQLIKTSAFFFAPTLLGIAFWLVTSSTGVAGPNLCTLCHKHVLTITLACNSLEYRRHVDHGDTMGPCPGTAINGKDAKLRRENDGGGGH